MDEAFFEACPQNEPVESCETSYVPATSLTRKLQEEMNYHVYGSRMDKAETRSVAYSAGMQEEERKRRVSYDPFAKARSAPQAQDSYLRAGNAAPNASHPMAHYNPLWQQSLTGEEIPFDPNILYGAGAADFRPAEDVYVSSSVNTAHVNKPPVPETAGEYQPKQPTRDSYLPKSLSPETGK